MGTGRLAAVIISLGVVGCPPPEEPSAQDAAAYFGLADGRDLLFDVTDGTTQTTARHVFKKTDSFADKLAFAREERNAGNILTETLVLEAAVEEMLLLRDGDCLPRCTDFTTPPVLLRKPIVANTSYETNTGTRVVNNGTPGEGPRQRHLVVVGAESNLSTPAGIFKGYTVMWRVFTDGQTSSVDREMFFAPDKGVVQVKQRSNTYQLRSGVSP